MKIDFKLADETDIEELVNVCNICFDEDTSIADAKESFKLQKNDKNQLYVIGLIDNKIVAHTRIAIIPTIFSGMDTYAILNHVCVLEEYRHHKIATEMLKVVEKLCQDRGCTSLKLWSKNFRTAAHACYKNFGFQTIDAAFFEKEI